MIKMSMDQAQADISNLLDRLQDEQSLVVEIDGFPVRFERIESDQVKEPRLGSNGLLAHLDEERVLTAYAAAPGRELEGKFQSPESSSALAANAFGYFLERPSELPALPGLSAVSWPALTIDLEHIVRFPWSGGRHPCLDVLVTTEDCLIGIESKRFEPFRTTKKGELSSAYDRPVWGRKMGRFEQLRDDLSSAKVGYKHLDAVQLLKHAFGLRTEGQRRGLAPILVYLFAEPSAWPNGTAIELESRRMHRTEIDDFASRVSGDEVIFYPISYDELLKSWIGEDVLEEHAWQVRAVFNP